MRYKTHFRRSPPNFSKGLAQPSFALQAIIKNTRNTSRTIPTRYVCCRLKPAMLGRDNAPHLQYTVHHPPTTYL